MLGENGWTSLNHEYAGIPGTGRCYWCGDYVNRHFYVPTDDELEVRRYHDTQGNSRG